MRDIFIEVVNENQIDIIESLAREIWTEHYTLILGQDQVEHMLRKFQSKESISAQIKNEGYRYLLIKEKGEYIGYIGFQLKDEECF